jgi:hypothetical protein
MACGLDRTIAPTVSPSDNPKISLINQRLTSGSTDGQPIAILTAMLGLTDEKGRCGTDRGSRWYAMGVFLDFLMYAISIY